MSRYELQKEIFRMTMNLYPHLQHEEVYKRLQKLWKREHKALEKYYLTMKEICDE
jgi:hypothetical protein